MARLRIERAEDVCRAIRLILEAGLFPHIQPGMVHCVRSWGSRSTAIARIYGLPRQWIVALGYNPGYVVEVISERFDPLPGREKIRVLIHELLHIPYTGSGALRPHGRLVNRRAEHRLLEKFTRSPLYQEALRALQR